MRIYKYVGSAELLTLVKNSQSRKLVKSQADILDWIKENNQKLNFNGEITATFVITPDKNLWITDRHSEHIVCANGGDVLSAGEITFFFDKENINIIGVTNQSTGFCPEPESWEIVAKVLDEIYIQYPKFFTHSFLFRLCEECQTINLVKEKYFVCAVCNSELNTDWNFENT